MRPVIPTRSAWCAERDRQIGEPMQTRAFDFLDEDLGPMEIVLTMHRNGARSIMMGTADGHMALGEIDTLGLLNAGEALAGFYSRMYRHVIDHLH